MPNKEIGKRLGWIIDEIYGSRKRYLFVKDVGISGSGRLSNYIAGHNKIPQYIFDWLSSNTDVNLHWLQTGEGEPWLPPSIDADTINLDELIKKGITIICEDEQYSAEEVREILKGIQRAKEYRNRSLNNGK